MHHKKRMARLLLCVLALAMALSACGKKGGAFQGTVTQITGTQVTVTPDPGAAILKQADSVTFDASGIENLQATLSMSPMTATKNPMPTASSWRRPAGR